MKQYSLLIHEGMNQKKGRQIGGLLVSNGN